MNPQHERTNDQNPQRTPPPQGRPHPYTPRNGPPSTSPAWERETNKCVGREVTVTQYVGVGAAGELLFIDRVGICVAIQSTHLSVILMTDTEKLIIKNVAAIRRTRSKNNPPKTEVSNGPAEG